VAILTGGGVVASLNTTPRLGQLEAFNPNADPYNHASPARGSVGHGGPAGEAWL
jgi:hypothetical protein